MRATAFYLCVLWFGSACGQSSQRPAALPAHTVLARRVLSIFERAHVLGRTLDAPLLERMSALLIAKAACPAAAASVRVERPHLERDLRAGEFGFLRDAAHSCKTPASYDAEAEALDALAKAYDPHSAYVPAARQHALSQEHTEPARGRIVEYAGERIAVIVLPSFYLL